MPLKGVKCPIVGRPRVYFESAIWQGKSREAACPLGANFYDVRFTPESDRLLHCREVTLCAISDQSAVQQLFDHFVGAG